MSKFLPTEETRRVTALAGRFMDAERFSRFEKLAFAGATVDQVDAVAKAKATTGTSAGGSGFEAAVAAHLAAHPGAKKSEAMTACRKADPVSFQAWLRSQQR